MSSPSTVILITGANSGVGYATTEVIAAASPAYHVIIGSRNLENGKKALSEIQASGEIKGSLSAIQLDVNDDDSIAAAVKDAEKQYGRLDVLINNAGVISQAPTLRQQIEESMRTNVAGPMMVVEAFKPLLLKSKSPYSIHVTSGLGSLGLANDPNHPYYPVKSVSYRASKAALDMVMLQESKELGKEGVKSFAVCPGLVVSNLRGKSEEARSAQGYAGDPKVAGNTILEIVEGKRDADVGKIVHKDGVYPW